jgi:hypothetical protein
MEWSWANNPFIAIALESRPRAVKVADFSFAALEKRKLDAFFGPLYLQFKLVYDPMKGEQVTWETQKGTQKGSTKSLDDTLLDLSPGKINLWDRQISNVFAPGTPEYIALLPNGHAPFGAAKKKDDRILAVKTLGKALDGIVALAATKADVDAFYASLDAARTGQKGQISTTKDNSEEMTDAMMNCMVGLYAVLGACIAKFAATPEDIKPIFDISTIRDIAQTLFTSTVKKGINTTDFIVKRTLPAGRFVKITVLSSGALDFGITDEKNDPIGAKKVTVQGMEDEIIEVSQLQQQSGKSSFFKVANTNNLLDGHFKIEILPEGSRGIAN